MHQHNAILVEDEPLISLMIQDYLADLGWAVDGTAHTEADAFALLNGCRPELALLDINLGKTTSLAVASACRDMGIAVVFITGYVARDVPYQCGNSPVLPKPFSPADLQVALRRGLAQVDEYQHAPI